MELIKESGGVFFNFFRFLCAYANFLRVEVKLSVYETLLSLKTRFGIRSV